MLARKVRIVSGGEGLDEEGVSGIAEGVLLSRVERRVVDVVEGGGAEEEVVVEEDEREEDEDRWGVISSREGG